MLLFETASRHVEWLSHRQAVTAENIANADTPGYRSRDVQAFGMSLQQAGLAMMQTHPAHQAAPSQAEGGVQWGAGTVWDRALSGNDVALEAELMKSSETGRLMAFDTGLMRSFHRMVLSSLKV